MGRLLVLALFVLVVLVEVLFVVLVELEEGLLLFPPLIAETIVFASP